MPLRPQRGSPGLPLNPGRLVTDIIERRNESRKWMRKNLYDEMTVVWQALKCKTPPVFKKDRSGNETRNEDKSRTNVAMPDLNIIYRRNAARMTAQPYRLRYIGGDPDIADALSALAMQQYARSNEAFHDVRLVMSAEAFGWGFTKLYWDRITRVMKFRKGIMKGNNVVFRDRADIMRYKGAADSEINEAVDSMGPNLDDDEIAQFMAKSGTEIDIPTPLRQYEGPIVKFVFPGDIYLEPNASMLEKSSYVIEQYTENDLWLEKMSKVTYKDPDTGLDVNAFDPEALQELIDTGGDSDIRDNEPYDDLRDMFNMSIGKEREQEYFLPRNLRPRKKFNIIEQHSQDREDGLIWVTYVSEKWRDRPIGRMPYEWDLYGKYAYTDMTPLPDLISTYGDSTPRLLRHLYTMHNLTVAQNFDYVTNLLKPFILRRIGVQIEPEVLVRGLFRELQVQDLNGIKPLVEPPLPAGAFEREAQIMRMMSIAEPSLTSVEGGSDTNPQAGKTATTALLASKASDALTQFKFDGRNRYLRDLGIKKLWMNQQAADADKDWEIESRYFNTGTRRRVEQMSQGVSGHEQPMPDTGFIYRNGKVSAIRLNVMDIQQDFECEPEAGSYLAVDDEMRQQAAQNLTQVAMANPEVIDKQKVIRFQLSTIRGIGNPDDYLLPPQPPPPPSPKISVNIAVPMDKEPADIVNQLLPLIGLQPSDTLTHRDQMAAVTQTGEAADAADSMMGPGEQEQAEHQMGVDQANQHLQNMHEAQQQDEQRLHDSMLSGLEHGQAMTQQAQKHRHAVTEAEQAHRHSVTQAEQAHRHSMTQGAQQQDGQLTTAAFNAATRPQPQRKPNGKANGPKQ